MFGGKFPSFEEAYPQFKTQEPQENNNWIKTKAFLINYAESNNRKFNK